MPKYFFLLILCTAACTDSIRHRDVHGTGKVGEETQVNAPIDSKTTSLGTVPESLFDLAKKKASVDAWVFLNKDYPESEDKVIKKSIIDSFPKGSYTIQVLDNPYQIILKADFEVLKILDQDKRVEHVRENGSNVPL